MALTTGEFHTITLRPSTAAEWLALASPRPDLPPAITDALVTGANLDVFCVDAPTGSLAFEGGSVVGLVDSVLSSVSAPLSQLIHMANDGSYIIYGVNAGGAVSVYEPSLGILRAYTGPAIAALKAWLP